MTGYDWDTVSDVDSAMDRVQGALDILKDAEKDCHMEHLFDTECGCLEDLVERLKNTISEMEEELERSEPIYEYC